MGGMKEEGWKSIYILISKNKRKNPSPDELSLTILKPTTNQLKHICIYIWTFWSLRHLKTQFEASGC